MTQERDEFRAWLDTATPTEPEQRAAADAAWSRRRRAPVVGLALTVAAAVVLGVWWLRVPASSSRAPEYGSSLVMRVAGETEVVRIEVGVRKVGDE